MTSPHQQKQPSSFIICLAHVLFSNSLTHRVIARSFFHSRQAFWPRPSLLRVLGEHDVPLTKITLRRAFVFFFLARNAPSFTKVPADASGLNTWQRSFGCLPVWLSGLAVSYLTEGVEPSARCSATPGADCLRAGGGAAAAGLVIIRPKIGLLACWSASCVPTVALSSSSCRCRRSITRDKTLVEIPSAI